MCKSEFTEWAIIEELSIRRRLRTFLISWGHKTCIKHCNVDLSSWYELWFAIICIDMDIILHLSTAIQQFQRRFRLPGASRTRDHGEHLFNEISHEIILAPMCLCHQCKMWKSNVKNILTLAWRTTWFSKEFPNCAITYHVSTQPAVGAAKHHRQNAYLTAMFGHYIRGYFNN